MAIVSAVLLSTPTMTDFAAISFSTLAPVPLVPLSHSPENMLPTAATVAPMASGSSIEVASLATMSMIELRRASACCLTSASFSAMSVSF